MPAYQHASYAGETITLENQHVRLDVHKRLTGWGWGEIYTPSGKSMAVLEHLGEIMIRDQEIPMRLEAQDVQQQSGDFGERLVFPVKSAIVSEKLRGTSFEKWIDYPFVVAREYLEPMGIAFDTALDICVVPAAELLALAEATGEGPLCEGARKALEYCMPMQRPEGGDFWETPLHSPNLLAAGHAANAYYLGYRAFGDERYLERAIHWIRSLLPFTHLWQPDDLEMVYNTKPCLCASDWYFANWVRDYVQWEVLETFALSLHYGIDWGEIDPEIDWHRYHEGITVAALRWMIDRTDESWRPHNMPWTLDPYRKGLLDGCFADTHNSTTGNYGGMGIPPDVIAVNLLSILDRRMGDDREPV